LVSPNGLIYIIDKMEFVMFHKKHNGVTILELMISMAVLAGILATAVPNYSKFTAKRRTAGAVETLHAYIENAKMESIKRNQPVTVRFRNTYDGSKWCFGTTLGTTACNCVTTDTTSADHCDIDGIDSKLWYSDFGNIEMGNIDTFAGGNKEFTFDPARGMLSNPADSGSFELVSSNNDYKVTISINGMGRIRMCTDSSHKLVGYKTCS